MIVNIFSFIILAVALIFQLAKNHIAKYIQKFSHRQIFKYFFWSAVFAVFAYYLYLVYAQYVAWLNGGALTQLLVPPHQSIAYVFGYHFTRFAIYYIISLIVALLLLVLADRFNTKFERRFFEDEEPYLGALAVFVLGNPAWNYAWIYYVSSLLVVSVIGSLVISHWLKKKELFSLYWLWLSIAILIIIIKEFLAVSF